MVSLRGLWFAVLVTLVLPGAVLAGEPVNVEGVASPVQVVRHAVCSGVTDREPVGAGATFTATDGARLYFWCEVVSKVVPTTITHQYYQGDRLVVEVPLAIRGHRWRTWSYHTLAAGRSPGQWRIEAVDEWGHQLAEAKVTVTAP